MAVEPMLSLSNVLTILTLAGGVFAVIAQLRASAKSGEAKLAALIKENEKICKWIEGQERRTQRLEIAMVRMVENAKMSESGTFRVHVEGEETG